MIETKPDFYMTSNESKSLRSLRKCYVIKRIAAEGRDDYLLIRVSPPINGRDYGLVDQTLMEVIVAAHLVGITLFPIEEWPASVYVLRALIDHPEKRNTLREDELELLAWADLYKTEETAIRAGASYTGSLE